MNKLNGTQIIGIGIVIFGFIIYFLFENSIINTISGVLCAIGIGLVFKVIPFRK
jgi:multisubunit Na+/H+ antiporter MnhG subunit